VIYLRAFDVKLLMIIELKDRPEGFTDGEKLIPGRPYSALLPGGPNTNLSNHIAPPLLKERRMAWKCSFDKQKPARAMFLTMPDGRGTIKTVLIGSYI